MEIKARDLNHNINNNKSNKYIKSNRYIKSLSDKIDEASLNYLSQLLNNCYNYNKQLFNFKKNHYKKITGTNWILAYNNYIGYPVLFYNDNNADLLSFNKISHHIKELIDINYINIDKDLQEFLNLEQSDNDLNIINEDHDLLTGINIFNEFIVENNKIKPSTILQYAIKILISDITTPNIIFNQQILDYFINEYLYKNKTLLLLKLYRHRDFNRLKISITFDYLKKYDQIDDIKNLMTNPVNFQDMLIYKADYNKFIN